jgi:thiamine-monophosphate kinase
MPEEPNDPEPPQEASIIATVLSHCPSLGRHRPPAHPAAEPGDDAALTQAGQVVTVDLMAEGVHWDARCGPEDLGHKLVAVNASDVAAMGCRPTWALLALSLPSRPPRGWVEAFARGLGAGLARCGARLVGGDTTGSSGPITLSLTMAGQGPAVIPRSGARPDQDIWVSGCLGAAAAGFFDDEPEGLSWWRRPEPPLELGPRLAEAGLVSAMMDLSDGLSADLARLCAASGVGARIEPSLLPLHPSLDPASPRALAQAVAFGEDYQLLFTATPADREPILALGRSLGLRLGRIGQTTAQPALLFGQQAWPAPLFSHFPEPGVSR